MLWLPIELCRHLQNPLTAQQAGLSHTCKNPPGSIVLFPDRRQLRRDRMQLRDQIPQQRTGNRLALGGAPIALDQIRLDRWPPELLAVPSTTTRAWWHKLSSLYAQVSWGSRRRLFGYSEPCTLT